MGHRYWLMVLLCLCSCAQDTLIFVTVLGASSQVDSLQVTATHDSKKVQQLVL